MTRLGWSETWFFAWAYNGQEFLDFVVFVVSEQRFVVLRLQAHTVREGWGGAFFNRWQREDPVLEYTMYEPGRITLV